MQAAVYDEYGDASVIRIEEVAPPSPKADEVLIRVNSVSLNASDWEFLTAHPAYVRAWGPLKPKFRILGTDVAGRVVSVGQAVTTLSAGDAVFGDILGREGALAEFACAPAAAMSKIPDGLSFEQASALPQSSLVALQGLRSKKPVEPGHRVLINGAGGGSGSFAIQLAKLLGAEVTAVDSASKLEFMCSLGADHVLDYLRNDYTDAASAYDLVLDLVARRSLWQQKRALRPGGQYVLVGGTLGRIFQAATLGPLLSFGDKKLGLLAVKPNEGLGYVADLVVSGKLSVAIERQYTLTESAQALRHLGEGHALGKIVVKIADTD